MTNIESCPGSSLDFSNGPIPTVLDLHAHRTREIRGNQARER